MPKVIDRSMSPLRTLFVPQMNTPTWMQKVPELETIGETSFVLSTIHISSLHSLKILTRMRYQCVLVTGSGPTGYFWVDFDIKFSPGVFSKVNSDASCNRSWLQQIHCSFEFRGDCRQGTRRQKVCISECSASTKRHLARNILMSPSA